MKSSLDWIGTMSRKKYKTGRRSKSEYRSIQQEDEPYEKEESLRKVLENYMAELSFWVTLKLFEDIESESWEGEERMLYIEDVCVEQIELPRAHRKKKSSKRKEGMYYGNRRRIFRT